MTAQDKISPALAAFASGISSRIIFGQVLVQRIGTSFELRHATDADATEASLKLVDASALRQLAQFTSAGAFRPLKSSPNLRTGWRALLPDDAALERALAHLYPGAVADWFAVHPGAATGRPPKITSYREFTERQTGMYRITTKLNDALAGAVVRSCCAREFCLKQRLWTVNSSSPAPDEIEQKSLIPCLEPCAILLEFARKIVRLEQDEPRNSPAPALAPTTTVQNGNDNPSNIPATPSAECDFDAPDNPRRRRFVLEKRALER